MLGALETSLAAARPDLITRCAELLASRIEREVEAMAGWSPAGRWFPTCAAVGVGGASR